MPIKKVKHVIKHILFFIGLFVDKELTLYAASLSFYTIFTIIPLLLIMLTLLTSLSSFSEYYESIKSFVFSNLMPVNSEAIMEYIDSFLHNSTEIGVIGLAMVFITSLLFFQDFEHIANKIFHAKPRTHWQSVTTYFIMLFLTPLAIGLSSYITASFATMMSSHEITSGINILPLIPYVIMWGFFLFLFQVSANTKIELQASIISSFVTSIVFSISKNAFIYYVIYNKIYTTMYGSFSILMFLFLWIYLSWIIFVYGLKLCYLINRMYKKRELVKQ